jgi:predicted O-methyltransferase YrrM
VDTAYWLGRLQKRIFPALERRGFHLTPVNYYQPIPDTRSLTDAIWQRRSALVGIDMREAEQLALASRLSASYAAECQRLPRAPGVDHGFYIGNGWFDSIDAEFLYCLIRHVKPMRVIEIGSGYSTLVASEAARVNLAEDGHRTEINAIEPYPRDFLVERAGDRWQLTRSPVEEVPFSVFAALEANDILFIDSSHVVRIGGDVVYEFLEVIPRLAPGVLVHVHDIFLPDDYPQEWVLRTRRFWTEQYLLRAFLMFNSDFHVLLSSNILHKDHPAEMTQLFSSYPPRGYHPTSFWMQRSAG